MSLPKGEHGILKTLYPVLEATFGQHLLRLYHNCRPSCSGFSVHSRFLCSLQTLSQTSVRTSRPRQNPPITNVLPQATPPSHRPLREPESDFAHTPPSLTHAARGRRPLTPSLPSGSALARVAPADRWAPGPTSSLRPSHTLGPALAAATHVGVRAPAVAAAASPATAARNRSRSVQLSGRNHEPGRQQQPQRRSRLPVSRAVQAAVRAAVRGAGSRPAARQRVGPAGGGGGGGRWGGTGTAGPPWGPGEGGAATTAPASRTLFPRGCAGNLRPAWAPAPSSCTYANSLDSSLVAGARFLASPEHTHTWR